MEPRIQTTKLQRSGSIAEIVNTQRKTCADVIRESKILVNYDGLKAVAATKRPETPLEDNCHGVSKRASSGDVLNKKSPVAACFTPIVGLEFDFCSRPASSVKLDPLPLDRKTRSASSGPKSNIVKQGKKSSKPVEAFQNCSSKFCAAQCIGRTGNLKKGFSVDEMKGNSNQESDLKFIVEGKRCENSAPFKKPRQLSSRHHERQNHQPLQSQMHPVEQPACKIPAETGKEEKASNIKKANIKKINVMVPSARVLIPSPDSLLQKFTHQSERRDERSNLDADVALTQTDDKISDANSLRRSEIIRKSANESGENVRGDASGGDDDDDDDEGFVSALLENLKLSSKVENMKSLNLKLRDFYDELETRNLLGTNSRHRNKILKFITTLISLDCPSIILNVCRMMLALKVSGGNLANVTNLLVKMGEDKSNDKKFREENVMDAVCDTLLRLSGGDALSAETIRSLLNILKLIKSLSTNSPLTSKKNLSSQAMVTILVSLFPLADQLKMSGMQGTEHIKYLVFLTAITRNLLDVPGTSKIFIDVGIIPHLFEALSMSDLNEAVTMNSVRVLSKLSASSDCCSELSQSAKHMQTLKRVVQEFTEHKDIILRTCFVLGNLAAKHDDCRINYFDADNSLAAIISSYKYFLETANQESLMSSHEEPNGDKDAREADNELSTTEDVLVKILRLMANLTLNEGVGLQVAEEEKFFQQILDTLNYHRLSENKELLTNTMALLNNLSFYMSSKNVLLRRQDDLIRVLQRFINTKNEQCLSDVIRVFGNMSRRPEGRSRLATAGVDRLLVDLLESECNEVVFSSCGALINFMIDPTNRTTFSQFSGVQRLVEVLEVYGKDDWQLAGMACQILCNYYLGGPASDRCLTEDEGDEDCSLDDDVGRKEHTSVRDKLGPEAISMSDEVQHLKDLLRHYLEEPSTTQQLSVEMKDYVTEIWRSHFVPVARDLLQKLEICT